MRLVSWNVQRGSAAKARLQVEAILRFRPDIVALQEITTAAQRAYDEAFARHEMPHVEHLDPERGHGLMVASRWDLKRLPNTLFRIPEAEDHLQRIPPLTGASEIRMLSVRIEPASGPFELHCVHVPPGSSTGWRKADAFRAVYERLACASPVPRVLCGDLNEPYEDGPKGPRVEARNRYARQNAPRWNAAINSVIVGLADHDLPDIFRLLNPGATDWSFQGSGPKRRYDHVFGSRELRPASVRYLHEIDRLRHSDHTPIEAVFGP